MRCSWQSIVLVVGLTLLNGPVLAFADEGIDTSVETNSETEAATDLADDDEEYFELLKLFADTVDQVERNYVEPISKRELMEAAIKGVLSKLDPYSDYISPEGIEEFRTEVESEFGGIGIRVGTTNDRVSVVTPLYDTPAHKAGIVAGDQILRIGDTDTTGLKLDAAIQLMKGKIGTPISLSILHNNGKAETVEVTRELIQVETVMGRSRLPDGRWDFMLDAEKRIGYIRMTSFSRATAGDVRNALASLKERDASGLILDLRFNPGGLLSSAVEIADMFIKEGVIVGTDGRNVEKRTWEATGEGTFDKIPMVVLVNQYSASASEIVSAALQDHGRAVIVGKRTWGKGSVQNIIELEGGKSALKLTTASYTRPNGKNIHRFKGATENDEWGVSPSPGYDVELSGNEIRDLVSWNYQSEIIRATGSISVSADAIEDHQLQRALEYLSGRLAKATP
jgi:carboxyl-terminal processing protease